MKYKIGDLVEMDNIWDNSYALILDIDGDPDINAKAYEVVYQVLIQATATVGWISQGAILRKVDIDQDKA